MFRNVRYDAPVELGEEIGYPDWQLVPKKNEKALLDFELQAVTEKIYPQMMVR